MQWIVLFFCTGKVVLGSTSERMSVVGPMRKSAVSDRPALEVTSFKPYLSIHNNIEYDEREKIKNSDLVSRVGFMTITFFPCTL